MGAHSSKPASKLLPYSSSSMPTSEFQQLPYWEEVGITGYSPALGPQGLAEMCYNLALRLGDTEPEKWSQFAKVPPPKPWTREMVLCCTLLNAEALGLKQVRSFCIKEIAAKIRTCKDEAAIRQAFNIVGTLTHSEELELRLNHGWCDMQHCQKNECLWRDFNDLSLQIAVLEQERRNICRRGPHQIEKFHADQIQLSLRRIDAELNTLHHFLRATRPLGFDLEKLIWLGGRLDCSPLSLLSPHLLALVLLEACPGCKKRRCEELSVEQPPTCTCAYCRHEMATDLINYVKQQRLPRCHLCHKLALAYCFNQGCTGHVCATHWSRCCEQDHFTKDSYERRKQAEADYAAAAKRPRTTAPRTIHTTTTTSGKRKYPPEAASPPCPCPDAMPADVVADDDDASLLAHLTEQYGVMRVGDAGGQPLALKQVAQFLRGTGLSWETVCGAVDRVYWNVSLPTNHENMVTLDLILDTALQGTSQH